MRSSLKSALVLTTALAIALTGLELRAAAAAPENRPATVQQNADATEFSAARKRRRHRGNAAVPLAAFGAIVGTIGAIAAEQRRRDYYEYERQYDGPYYGGHVYHQPYAAPAPVYRHYGHQPRGHVGRGYDYGPRGAFGPGTSPQLGNPSAADRTPP